MITCQPEAAEALRLNGDPSHVKAVDLVVFRAEVSNTERKRVKEVIYTDADTV